jgi:hypothetical protein
MKKELLVVCIIFLFIGIAVAPSVTSIEFSKNKTPNNDLVEIDVQICKHNGVESNNKFITKEQDKQLDILFENQKEKLFNSKSTQETTEIHKEMIKSLYELGIISSEDKDSILSDIYGDNSKLSTFNIFKNILKYKSLFPTRIFNYKSSGDIKLFNALCLVSYSATYTTAKNHLFLRFFNRVGFGCDWYSINGQSGHASAKGYINTDGIFGIKNYEGGFNGGFGSFYGPAISPWVEYCSYKTGILYFKGVFVNKVGLHKSSGQGTALLVKI